MSTSHLSSFSTSLYSLPSTPFRLFNLPLSLFYHHFFLLHNILLTVSLVASLSHSLPSFDLPLYLIYHHFFPLYIILLIVPLLTFLSPSLSPQPAPPSPLAPGVSTAKAHGHASKGSLGYFLSSQIDQATHRVVLLSSASSSLFSSVGH